MSETIGSVSHHEFMSWPEKYRKLFESVNRARRNLWYYNIDNFVDEQIIESLDEVATFIRTELGS